MSRAWGDSWGDSWADSWGEADADAGIGLVDEGIGLAPPRVTPPVDFLIEGPILANFREQRTIFKNQIVRSARDEGAELREMQAMYSSWRKAA